jgi:flagellar basal body-associated protein FliL
VIIIIEVHEHKILFIIIIIIIIVVVVVSCHSPFLPGTSPESAVTPTAQASNFTLQ